MREWRGAFKKEGIETTLDGGFCPRKMLMGTDRQTCSSVTQASGSVPASPLSFHVARLLIANFNSNNNKKQVMEPESFTARENVIKKLKFKLPAACEHSLAAREQQFS